MISHHLWPLSSIWTHSVALTACAPFVAGWPFSSKLHVHLANVAPANWATATLPTGIRRSTPTQSTPSATRNQLIFDMAALPMSSPNFLRKLPSLSFRLRGCGDGALDYRPYEFSISVAEQEQDKRTLAVAPRSPAAAIRRRSLGRNPFPIEMGCQGSRPPEAARPIGRALDSPFQSEFSPPRDRRRVAAAPPVRTCGSRRSRRQRIDFRC